MEDEHITFSRTVEGIVAPYFDDAINIRMRCPPTAYIYVSMLGKRGAVKGEVLLDTAGAQRLVKRLTAAVRESRARKKARS